MKTEHTQRACGWSLGLMLLLSALAGEAQAENTGARVAQAARSFNIPARVLVYGPQIRLSELIKLSTLPPTLQAELSQVELGPSPRPGEVVSLPGSTVLTRIRSSAPGASALQWQVPPTVQVERAASRIEAAQVLESLRIWMDANQAVPVEQLQLSGLQVRAPLLVPAGAVTLDFEPAPGEDLLGPTSLNLLVWVDGVLTERVPVRIRVDGQLRVLVLLRPVRLGQEVMASDVQEELRPVATLTGQPALRRDEVVGRQARRALNANRVIGLEDVEDKPVLRKGDAVTIILRSGGLLLTAQGEALQDGRSGETISVLNTGTRKQLRGKVTATGEVRIDYRPPSQYLNSN